MSSTAKLLLISKDVSGMQNSGILALHGISQNKNSFKFSSDSGQLCFQIRLGHTKKAINFFLNLLILELYD